MCHYRSGLSLTGASLAVPKSEGFRIYFKHRPDALCCYRVPSGGWTVTWYLPLLSLYSIIWIFSWNATFIPAFFSGLSEYFSNTLWAAASCLQIFRGISEPNRIKQSRERPFGKRFRDFIFLPYLSSPVNIFAATCVVLFLQNGSKTEPLFILPTCFIRHMILITLYGKYNYKWISYKSLLTDCGDSPRDS